jgi:hypothetical protein
MDTLEHLRAAREAIDDVEHEARMQRRETAGVLMQRIAARCIEQLITHGYVTRRDLADLRRIHKEYRAANAAPKENG